MFAEKVKPQKATRLMELEYLLLETPVLTTDYFYIRYN